MYFSLSMKGTKLILIYLIFTKGSEVYFKLIRQGLKLLMGKFLICIILKYLTIYKGEKT